MFCCRLLLIVFIKETKKEEVGKHGSSLALVQHALRNVDNLMLFVMTEIVKYVY